MIQIIDLCDRMLTDRIGNGAYNGMVLDAWIDSYARTCVFHGFEYVNARRVSFDMNVCVFAYVYVCAHMCVRVVVPSSLHECVCKYFGMHCLSFQMNVLRQSRIYYALFSPPSNRRANEQQSLYNINLICIIMEEFVFGFYLFVLFMLYLYMQTV